MSGSSPEASDARTLSVMRVVRCDPPAPNRPAPALPDERLVAECADLARKHPEARLRRLAVVRAPDLDKVAGATVWLGLESLQVTGSFKVRGALVAVADAIERRGSGAEVVAASAGNHGAGVAWAAALLGARATICVPAATPEAKRARIRASGAELVALDAGGYDEAEDTARALSRERGAEWISPYDDVRVIAGNGASLGHELCDALKRPPATVLTPFGGGGLACGLALALRARGARTAVWGAQSEASPAMARSLERGAAETRLPVAPTLADALEGGIAEDAFERARRLVAGVVVVPEERIASAMAFLYKELGLVVEGGGATSLAAIDALPDDARGGDLVVLLTGRNVDRARLDEAVRGAARAW